MSEPVAWGAKLPDGSVYAASSDHEKAVIVAALHGGTVVPLVEQPTPVDEDEVRQVVYDAISDDHLAGDAEGYIDVHSVSASVALALRAAGVLS